MTTRIVLVDDHVLVRSGMRALLDAQPDFEVTGEASDGAEGVELALNTHPDVVLMDLAMPVLDGIEATKRILAAGSKARILVVTSHDDDSLVVRALRAGATGFFLKDAAADRLAEAVRAVAKGDTLLAPTIAKRLVDSQLTGARPALRHRFNTLTERERDICRRLARGLSNAALATELGLSEATIKTHVTRLLSKLDVRSRVQAVVLAYESGFIRPGHTGDMEL
ncbi:response regulator transcription factor [Solirubrobacter ginsenosidimutans]|uniref:Response regulator transcription factor n=1 Tax=Solirubrobacter ginsenosidimutans TaxID=490573 RepID=A0A9X3S082_9ACTN|nr:response regulator transcription factor [Solirubrobacter ginsenosidimutans]MDA0159752.1 response regulator transcription factor [Solirubrobacter ginsenosidimutans]